MKATSSSEVEKENDQKKPLIIVIAGPTAIGKSAVAASLCSPPIASQILSSSFSSNPTKSRGHVISADSVQAYTGVSIGANKPTCEEMECTPHHLINVVNVKGKKVYNAADWMKDANLVIQQLYNVDNDENSVVKEEEEETKKRQELILQQLNATRCKENDDDEQPILPVVVGGTMMYLQWLVHGRPDAMKPTVTALQRAKDVISKYQAMDDENGNVDEENENDEEGGGKSGWEQAVEHVASHGPIFQNRIDKLCGKDWYRLRRTLEVAYTVHEMQQQEEQQQQQSNTEQKNKDLSQELSLYTGDRSGGLLDEHSQDLYDVRCFFLCPNDRMAHTALIDYRCEQMLCKGLLRETTDLFLDEQELLPLESQPARAIGYRQTLAYLFRTDAKMKDGDALQEYLNEFTTATRRYAKKQMSWFRKDEDFLFVPVNVLKEEENNEDDGKQGDSTKMRIEKAADIITQMCLLSREEYEQQLITTLNDGDNDKNDNDDDSDKEKKSKKQKQQEEEETYAKLPLSAQTKLQNEKQGKNMKFYKPRRYIIVESSKEYEHVMAEADECTRRMQGL